MNIGRFNVLEGKDTILNYRISVHWLLHIPGSYGGKSPDLNWWLSLMVVPRFFTYLGSENPTR